MSEVMKTLAELEGDSWALGLPWTAAEKRGQDMEPPVTIRVVMANNQPLVCTRDFNANRLNVETVRDLIVCIRGRG